LSCLRPVNGAVEHPESIINPASNPAKNRIFMKRTSTELKQHSVPAEKIQNIQIAIHPQKKFFHPIILPSARQE
jgi:hypothetical protein